MTTDASRLQRALALFEAVVDLQSDERKLHLDAACASDTDLRAAVEAMLHADHTTDSLPTAPSGWLEGSAMSPEDDGENVTALRFGPWQVTGVLGRGGMGAVYRVERADGAYRQAAALKRIRMGLDTPDAQQRFLRERQILATLRHPHIARLLDGGVAGETPYFAMELVEGERIDRWCDRRRLPIRDRVQLFLQVLDAVSEAHRNLIVHRDLKPSNVLVDDSGQSHLLDFGIAQLLEDDSDAAQTQHRAFTPDFAAPEQLRAEPVTTASDVYQLGVMLYLLVCGRHPFGIDADTPWHRKIALLDKPPTLPARAMTESAALERNGTPRSLSKQIFGDLEAILLRAIAHAPAARYPSADAFRSDLRAWLDGESVQARLPSRGERLRRLVRRNRLVFASGTAVVAALAVGFGSALLEARRAHRSETVALQQRALAELNARQSAAIQETFELMLMHAMAIDGGRKTSVREMADGAIRTIDTKSGRGDSARISLLLDLIRVYIVANQKDGAHAMLEKVRPQAMTLAASQPVFAFRVKALEADLLEETDPQKIPRFRDAYAFARGWMGTTDESTFEIVRNELVNYAYSLDWRGMADEYSALMDELHALTLSRYGPRNPRTLQMAINKGRALIAIGRHREAEGILQEQLALATNHFGASGQLATSTQSLIAGNAMLMDGGWWRAESMLRDLLVKYQKPHVDVLGERTVRAHLSLIRLLQVQRRDPEASAELERVEPELTKVLSEDRDLLRTGMLVLRARQASNMDNAAESLKWAEEAMSVPWQRPWQDSAKVHIDALLESARARATLGDCKTATRQIVDALDIRAGFPQKADFSREWAQAADIERQCGQNEAALRLARLASGNLSRLPEPGSWCTGVVTLALARALAATGHSVESAQAYQRAEAAFARVVPSTHPYRAAIAQEHRIPDPLATSEAPW